MNINMVVFRPKCSLCGEPRGKMGQGIPDRLKAMKWADYRWCKVCDRA